MPVFIYKSATELASLIRQKKATSFEIVKEHLEHIEKNNAKINALIYINKEEALNTAKKCDEEAETGKFRGSLHGVPLTVKESFWIKGLKSTLNNYRLKDFTAPEDAVVISRIKKVGGIILGKTNVPRNLFDYQVKGDLFPEGKNPYNTEYSPGGSTGGGAAAVAAGFSPLELGTDIGGSIRVPANFCGLYGLKPTENTIPYHGLLPKIQDGRGYIMQMMQAGPLARSIEDIELLWKVIRGPHESDRNIPSIDWKAPSDKPLNEYKIAWTDQWGEYQAGKSVSSALKELIQKPELKNINVNKVNPEMYKLYEETLKLYISLFAYVVFQNLPWYYRLLVIYELKTNLLKGFNKYTTIMMRHIKMNARYYAQTLRKKAMIVEQWEQFFRTYDFLICPVAFGPAFKRCKTGSKIRQEGKKLIYNNYAWPYSGSFNASGHPSITIPLGIGEHGLPLGVQIVGPYWSEPELFHFAKQLTGLTKGFENVG